MSDLNLLKTSPIRDESIFLKLCKKYLIHLLVWMLYGAVVYAINVTGLYRQTSYVQILAGLPPLAVVFYLGSYVVRRYPDICSVRRIGVALLSLFVLLPLSYLWIYNVLPLFRIQLDLIDEVKGKNGAFIINSVQYFVRFFAYGALYAHLSRYALLERLRVRTLQLEVAPHYVFNAWSTVLARLDLGRDALRRLISGYVNLQRYAFKSSKLNADVIAIEVELAKLRSWIASLDLRVDLIEHGESKGQLVLPLCSIELLQNALKYSDPSCPVVIDIKYRPGGLRLTVMNSFAKTGLYEGLGAGLNNLQQRICFSKHLSGRLTKEVGHGQCRVELVLEKKSGSLVRAMTFGIS